MFKKIFLLFIANAFYFTSFGQSFAGSELGTIKHDWEKLGQRFVAGQSDTDAFLVTGAKGEFKAVRFKVDEAPVLINSVNIVYQDGSQESYTINESLMDGEFSEPRDLSGFERTIVRVYIDYTYLRPNHDDMNAVVTLLGK